MPLMPLGMIDASCDAQLWSALGQLSSLTACTLTADCGYLHADMGNHDLAQAVGNLPMLATLYIGEMFPAVLSEQVCRRLPALLHCSSWQELSLSGVDDGQVGLQMVHLSSLFEMLICGKGKTHVTAPSVLLPHLTRLDIGWLTVEAEPVLPALVHLGVGADLCIAMAKLPLPGVLDVLSRLAFLTFNAGATMVNDSPCLSSSSLWQPFLAGVHALCTSLGEMSHALTIRRHRRLACLLLLRSSGSSGACILQALCLLVSMTSCR